MTTTSTRPFSLLFSIALLWFLQLISFQDLYAQGNNGTPTFNVDLSGNPNGTWTSGEVIRNGQLCSADKADNCVQFNIKLNQNSGGLQFLILEGPEPSGSMGYQISCGPQMQVGKPICVSGPGPHILTLCMPGGAKGIFKILSVPAFNKVDDAAVTQGCSSVLQAPTAFKPETITWRDISGKGYEKFLSFPNGKATPVITPDASAPAYVDYEVCGASQTSECATLPYCDVMRVYFYPPPVVTIGPTPAIICPGGSGVELTGNVTGGDGEFEYIWTDSNGNVKATTQNYTATAIGLYTLEVRTKNYPNCRKFAASVNVVTNLTVSAGPDQLVCSSGSAQLAGTVTAALGGIWSGGSGTFSDRTALDAVYTPSAADLSAGSVKFTLTSTGNGSCTAVKDEVLLTFYNMNVSLMGTPVICNGTLGTISANVTGGQGTLKYIWSSGETTAAISNKPAGAYTVAVSDGKGCEITKAFTITQVTGPSDLTATLKASTCGSPNGEIIVTGVAGGTAPYTYSKNGTTFQSAATFTALAAGSHTITVKDANGCTIAKTYTLTNTAGPTAVVATTQAASCQNNDGRVTVGTVTGGTAPYTYAVDGTNFQTSTTFAGLASGTHTVTAKDANNCSVTTSVTITTDIPTSFTSTAAASTCGASNGQLTITGVTGGFAPYTYSTDGKTFQSAATFTALSAGNYTITVKDDRGCTISRQVPVTNIAGPSDLTATAQSSTCGSANGQVTVSSVSGGTAPYTYSRDGVSFQATGTFQNLPAGTYAISAKDVNGCVYTEQVTVTDIAGPAFAATAKSSTCGNSNGSITVGAVTGGTAPFSFSKDGSTFQAGTTFTALAAGDYTITIKDKNGCLSTRAVTVSNIAGPSDVALTGTSSTCGNPNGQIKVGAVTGGTAPYTYAINSSTAFQAGTTFSALLADEYTITVKDANGCIISKKVTVGNAAGPSDMVVSNTPSTCGATNGELTVTAVTGGTAPFAYSRNGVDFQSAAAFTGLPSGNYTITVKDANGCLIAETSSIINIPGPTAVTATSLPTSCANNDGTVTAGTVTGGTAPYLYSIDGSNFTAEKVFSGLASGAYTLTVKDANGCTVTTSVAVQKNVPTAFTSTATASTCGNGNGEIRVGGVTGGTAPYIYSVDGAAFQQSTTFAALTAGSHTITVKDANGCTYAKQVQVGNIAGPSDLTAAARSSTCGERNGQLTVSAVTGGTAPYAYALDGGTFQPGAVFSALAAGDYTVTVKDANGCLYTEQATVTDIAGPAFAATAKSSTCGN
ncbi:beta strand repeat-containing protein, partial [Pontibacter saemangeumensis]|uniref:beta strand repeat-containing protein n=1 Tax=Pontibacter saemangeumensis TaxID=1084525 RepID=UPI003CD06AE1